MPEEDWEYQVRHRAYELWNAAGRPDGKHQQFWEAAERELKRAAAGERQTSQAAGARAVKSHPAHPPAAPDGSHRDPV